MAHPRSMKVKEVKCEGLQATVVQRAAENNFKSVLFAIINCPETAPLAREVFKTKIATECRNYAKQRNSLNTTDPALVAEFRNSTFVKEVEIKGRHGFQQNCVRSFIMPFYEGTLNLRHI